MPKTLMIVDMQNDYFPGGKFELVGIEEAGQQAKTLLKTFREKGLKVIHIQHISIGEQAFFFLPNTKGVEINDCVKPEPGEIIVTKHYPNSFRETNLLDYINPKESEELFICGAMSQMCIDATVRAACDLGFNCTVASDACATLDLRFMQTSVTANQVHASFMVALQMFYATVLNTADILETRLNT
ncbi:cysteine hydrolase [bacterium]|nr:cysteine hydrolase [bacterium]